MNQSLRSLPLKCSTDFCFYPDSIPIIDDYIKQNPTNFVSFTLRLNLSSKADIYLGPVS